MHGKANIKIATLSDEDEIIEIPRCNHEENTTNAKGKKKNLHHHHHHDTHDDDDDEFEHCFCHEHASFVQSRFHEVLLDFFSGQHNFDVCSDHSTCEQFYDKHMFKDMARERFAADWGSVRTDIRSEGEMKYSVGKVPQQLSRPKVALLNDKPTDPSHPGVVISWAKKTPRVDILQYFLELRIQNCEELDTWVLIYQGSDKEFTCTRLPRGAKCGFRVQGENENGKGKWSEESLVIVPGNPTNKSNSKNSLSATDTTQSKRKKKRKRKKTQNTVSSVSSADSTALAVQFRTELNELLRKPSTDLLRSLIKRLKDCETQSNEIQHVLDDAFTALEIKEEEIALRSQISQQILKEEEDIPWNQINEHSNSNKTNDDCADYNAGSGISSHQAEKTLRQLNRVAAVRSKLQGALASNNIKELELAIEMAEQWENSQLHCEIQACNDKIRQLSIPDIYAGNRRYVKPIFSCAEQFSDFVVNDEDKQYVLMKLKKLSGLPDKEITQDALLQAIHSAAPWATQHPFIEFIHEFQQRIHLRQEIKFGKKLLKDALHSENVEEIVRCLQQVLHMKDFGLEKEIHDCSQTLEQMHISELKRLLQLYCANPSSVPEIQQLLQQAMIYQDVLYKEILTAQDQLHYNQPKKTHGQYRKQHAHSHSHSHSRQCSDPRHCRSRIHF